MLSLEKQNAWRAQYQQRRPGWQPATELYAAWVRQQLRPGSRVLDLGCGRGGLVEQLAAEGLPLAQVVGIDPDWHSLHEHRLRLPRAQAFSHPLPFAAASFDLIFASWLLEHLPRPGADLAEIARVLRPGGAFVFITPNKRHPLATLNRLFGRLGRWQGQLVARLYGRAAADTFPTYYRANTAGVLAQLALAHGLALEQLAVVPDPTYLAFNAPLFRLACAVEERLPATWGVHLVGVLAMR
ncbi:MAG: class I SAM-dependent methyltransferase [Ardenticatenaceae bacterium]|nr:class I SAM-dependent methyltransferase [Ardenticatenaceae bacterium]